jgi:hypothetical protein
LVTKQQLRPFGGPSVEFGGRCANHTEALAGNSTIRQFAFVHALPQIWKILRGDR